MPGKSFVLSVARDDDLPWAESVIAVVQRRGGNIELEEDYRRRNHLPRLDGHNSPRSEIAQGRAAIERALDSQFGY